MNTNIKSLFLALIFSSFSSFAYSASTSVSVGTDHSCAIVDGGLQCWGGNSHGQLGNGTTTSSSTPVRVTGLESGVTHVSAGRAHTCAIANSEVYCWGSNQNSQVGPSAIGYAINTPQIIYGLTGSTSISAGSGASCAIQNSSLKCWGENIGVNPLTFANAPVLVSGMESGVTTVTVGNHACAVLNGSAKCWGLNFKGQLGNYSQLDSSTPVNISGNNSGYSDISTSAGALHTCGVKNGSVLCWGYNINGQLGNGFTEDSQIPVNVTGISSGATAVSTTNSSSCAIVNGNVFCWGSNGAGRLGNNSTAPSLVPVQTISINSQARSISSGEYRTCVNTINDKVYCWGAGVGNSPTEVSFSAAQQTQVQTITFTSPGGSKTFISGSTFEISATSTSNLPISFTTDANGYICTVTGSTVTMVRQGSCTITASQSGNANYLAATPVSHTIELTPKVYQTQTLTIQGEINQMLPIGGTIALTATSSSGLPVVLSSRSPDVCTVTNNVVKTVAATGRCDIAGNQAGNDTYSPAYAYYQVWILFSETRTQQTISMNLGGSRTASIGDTFSISASASSGLPVEFGASPISVCRLSGSVITVMGAGTCAVHAYQAGNSNFLPTTADGSISISIVAKQSQAITLSYPPSVSMMAGDQFNISGISTSGLTVSLENLTPTVCSISNWTVTVIKDGLCGFRATQAGNTNFNSATADGGTNIILIQGQTINFNPPSSVTMRPGERFIVPVTSSSGLAVTLSSVSPSVCTASGTTVTVVAAGYCELRAYQGGTTTIRPITEARTVIITLGKQSQSITLSYPPSVSVGVGDQFNISGISSSGLPVSLDNLTPTVCSITGWRVTVIKDGLCGFRATQTGDATFNAATADGATNIILINGQTISFNPPASVTLNPGERFVVPVTASSGLAVTLSSLSSSVCTVSGTTVTVVAPGYCQLQAFQAGTTTIRPVTVSGTVMIVAQAAPTIRVTNNGSSMPGTQTTISVNNPINGLSYSLLYRAPSEQWSANRTIPLTSSFISFDMPAGFDIYVGAILSNSNFTPPANEVRITAGTQPQVSGRYVNAITSPSMSNAIKKNIAHSITWNKNLLNSRLISAYLIEDSSAGISNETPSLNVIKAKRRIELAKDVENNGNITYTYTGTKIAPRVLIIGSDGNWSISEPNSWQANINIPTPVPIDDFVVKLATNKYEYTPGDLLRLNVKSIANISQSQKFNIALHISNERTDLQYYFNGTKFVNDYNVIASEVEFPIIRDWANSIEIPINWEEIGGYGNYRIGLSITDSSQDTVAYSESPISYRLLNTAYSSRSVNESGLTTKLNQDNGTRSTGNQFSFAQDKIATLGKAIGWGYRVYEEAEKLNELYGYVEEVQELASSYEDWQYEYPSDYADNLLAINMLLKLLEKTPYFGDAVPATYLMDGIKSYYSALTSHQQNINNHTWDRNLTIKLSLDCYFCSKPTADLKIYLYPLITASGTDTGPYISLSKDKHVYSRPLLVDKVFSVSNIYSRLHTYQNLQRGLYMLEVRRLNNNAVVHREQIFVSDTTLADDVKKITIAKKAITSSANLPNKEFLPTN